MTSSAHETRVDGVRDPSRSICRRHVHMSQILFCRVHYFRKLTSPAGSKQCHCTIPQQPTQQYTNGMMLLVNYSLLLTSLLLTQAASFSTTTRNSLTTKSSTSVQRRLLPPFPDGVCGGKVITLPPQETYLIDSKLNGNPLVLPPRPIDVWLPPTYSTEVEHPVLLCHDGQNAMSDADSWTGASWRMIGALTRLADRNLLRTPLPIVVMLPSADGDLVPGVRRRHLEYAADGLFAEAHADFVVRTVKPLIENRFSTAPGEVYTIGSSLGGQASLQLLMRYPQEFAGAACLSPYFEPATLASVVANGARALKSKRLYMDIGGDMGVKKVPVFDLLDHLTPEHWWNPGYWWLDSQLQAGVGAMERALSMSRVDFMYHQEPGGRHNERAWAQRIDLPLLHLFGK